MITLVVGKDCPDTETFGRLLRRIRASQSVRILAQEIGVSQGYIRTLERGDRAPSPAVAVDLLRALDLAVSSVPSGIAFTFQDQPYEVRFQHWNGDSWRIQEWRDPRRDGSSDLFGQLVRKLAAMDEDRLRYLAGLIDPDGGPYDTHSEQPRA